MLDNIDSAELRTLLGDLEEQTLKDWDAKFVDDMLARLERWGRHISVTPAQWEQLRRMQKEYLDG
jgi:hypothetical protein